MKLATEVLMIMAQTLHGLLRDGRFGPKLELEVLQQTEQLARIGDVHKFGLSEEHFILLNVFLRHFAHSQVRQATQPLVACSQCQCRRSAEFEPYSQAQPKVQIVECKGNCAKSKLHTIKKDEAKNFYHHSSIYNIKEYKDLTKSPVFLY